MVDMEVNGGENSIRRAFNLLKLKGRLLENADISWRWDQVRQDVILIVISSLVGCHHSLCVLDDTVSPLVVLNNKRSNAHQRHQRVIPSSWVCNSTRLSSTTLSSVSGSVRLLLLLGPVTSQSSDAASLSLLPEVC